MISIIAALTKDRVIGKENRLIWHLSEDLKNFKRLTTGNTIVMGRKTYESIGRPLPNRNNIVISRTMGCLEGVEVVSTAEAAMEKGKALGKEIFIIGGAEIYGLFLPKADKMYLSYVKGDYEGDAYFPPFDEKEWNKGEVQKFDQFDFIIYERRS